MMLLDRLTGDDPDAVLDAFVEHLTANDISMYPAQEEAILELLAGSNVVLTTPTGSGKSLVAEAAHLAALSAGRRSVYTAPIKALVSEKFFALCRTFGSENVGMVTGDAAVNADAPIIACTAEILAHQALRRGNDAGADLVIMDEFHFYAEPQRGWAWQVPLLELRDTQFLLMSATMGPTEKFCQQMTERTGRLSVEVTSTERPVPLDFVYRTTPLHESIEELVNNDLAPVYVVHFTQKDAMSAAQSMTSLTVLTKDEKQQVKEAIGGFRFDSPVGKDLKKYLTNGIGVHHAGLLPKYRLLVEKLAQLGLLKLIAGTDTLGVGVNVPIRTVLFTQLCKYDGTEVRVLKVREFQQIAGRAGRRGYDTQGHVWVQAPAHWVENRRAEEKAASAGRKKKVVKKKAPEWGFAAWNQDTFTRLMNGSPEPLFSSFGVSHQMLLNVLDRPGDGCAAMRQLLVTNHEPRKRQRAHIRRAISMYRSLVDADVIEQLPNADSDGRTVRVKIDLQDEFALHQPLSLFAVEILPELDQDDPMYALEVLSVVEGVLEDPRVILAAQLKKIKDQLVNRLKSEGVEYDQRMEELDAAEYPKPLADFLYGSFNVFREHHPWVGGETVRPKSVAREMWESGMGFRSYVEKYGLKRSEGVLLRYLADAYKGLVQNVPENFKTDDVYDMQEWLGELIRQVDSSLLDEWERLTNPDLAADPQDPHDPGALEPERVDVTRNERAFRVMVRNELFRWVQTFAGNRYGPLTELPSVDDQKWRLEDIVAAAEGYWAEYDSVGIDTDARHMSLLIIDQSGDQRWPVQQILADPEGHHEWRFTGEIDLVASAEAGEAVVLFGGLERLIP